MKMLNKIKEMAVDKFKGLTFKKVWHTLTHDCNYWLSFIVLLIVAVIIKPSFLRWTNISNLFIQGAIIGICSMGMSLVISAGMIDLSTGSIVAIVSGLGIVILNKTHSIIVCFLFCIVFGFVLGALNGLLVTKGRIAPFIVTLATMSAWRSVINQLGKGGPFIVDNSLYESFRKIASGSVLGIPNLMWIFCLIALITAFIMKKTKFGTYVYAVGSNEGASRLSGINVDMTKIKIFTYAGLMYGLAAFLLASRLTSIQAASAGSSYEMDAIAAVAIGGTAMSGGKGSILGTFIGVLILRIINTVLIMANVPPFLNGLVTGIVIIVAVLAQTMNSRRK